MGGLTEDVVIKRLQDLVPSQEGIETISLWMMHHKDKHSIETIVEGWLACFKLAASDQHRTALFYVMNDVVQKSKLKMCDMFIVAFQPAVLTAVSLGKTSEKVRNVMARCIDIFGERHVFTKASVATMKNMLYGDDSMDGEDSCVELDNDELVKKIENFEAGRERIDEAMEVLRNADYNFQAKIREQMRDRSEAAQLLSDSERSLAQVCELRKCMERQRKKMMELIEVLELAKRIYSHHLREVTVVEDAYQKFGLGMREVHEELKEMARTGEYPGATPPRDAPSPDANDDIYATGVEHALEAFRQPMQDNLEAADMELGDDDDNTTHGGTSRGVPTAPSLSSFPLTGLLPPPPKPPTIPDPRMTKATTSEVSPSSWPADQAMSHQTSANSPEANAWKTPATFMSSVPPPPFTPSMPPPHFLTPGAAGGPPSFPPSTQNVGGGAIPPPPDIQTVLKNLSSLKKFPGGMLLPPPILSPNSTGTHQTSPSAMNLASPGSHLNPSKTVRIPVEDFNQGRHSQDAESYYGKDHDREIEAPPIEPLYVGGGDFVDAKQGEMFDGRKADSLEEFHDTNMRGGQSSPGPYYEPLVPNPSMATGDLDLRTAGGDQSNVSLNNQPDWRRPGPPILLNGPFSPTGGANPDFRPPAPTQYRETGSNGRGYGSGGTPGRSRPPFLQQRGGFRGGISDRGGSFGGRGANDRGGRGGADRGGRGGPPRGFGGGGGMPGGAAWNGPSRGDFRGRTGFRPRGGGGSRPPRGGPNNRW